MAVYFSALFQALQRLRRVSKQVLGRSILRSIEYGQSSNQGRNGCCADSRAAAALVPVIPAKPAASGQQSNSGIRKIPDPQLERQLAAIDQKWMESARTKKLDYLKQ